MDEIKVYVKVKDGYIVDINSEIFIDDLTDWILYDKGIGDKYAHAQSNYFEKPLINEDGTYNFEYKEIQL